MTRLERQIWQRWKQYHKNTAEIAKGLGIPEHEVERTLHRIKSGFAERSSKTGDA